MTKERMKTIGRYPGRGIIVISHQSHHKHQPVRKEEKIHKFPKNESLTVVKWQAH